MKNFVEIVFILDRSGSMQGLEKDTIGGFNALLAKQGKGEGRALVSTVLFDDTAEVLHDRVPLEQVPRMTEKEYYVRGCTALLDAMGGAIHHISSIHRYARQAERPAKTMVIIITDGMENASRRYRLGQVKNMVERQKEKYGWEFQFLGANMDAIATAAHVGIDADRAVTYACDAKGTALNYEVVAEAIQTVRCAEPIAPQWKKRIDEDRRSRKNLVR